MECPRQIRFFGLIRILRFATCTNTEVLPFAEEGGLRRTALGQAQLANRGALDGFA